jgi:hypothetical protein
MRAARRLAVLLAAAGGALLVLVAVSGVFAWMLVSTVTVIATGEETLGGGILLRAGLMAALAVAAFAAAAFVATRPLLAAGLAALPVPLLLLHARVDPHWIFLVPAAVLLAAVVAALWSARRR